jgi:hypothetical protein
MKKLLLFSLLSLFVCDVYAQGWRKIDQSFLGMKYKLPKSWTIDGFGYSDWEEYGSFEIV